MQEPDPRVVRAAAAGDEAAFTALVRATQPHVWRFVRHLLGDEDGAGDVTQETFVRVHRSLGTFRHDARFTTWLLRIARNATVDEQRRRASRRRTEASVVARPYADDDAALGSEIRAALDSLPPALREAFVVVEVFGHRYQDAAEVLDIPTGTVKSRVFRARAALVAWFEAPADQAGGTGG